MRCPACDKRIEGKRCSCGWIHPSITPSSAAHRTCSWAMESRRCAMLATADGLCGWHRYWVRLIDHGAPGRDEQEEFADWWEQFQPTGPYGESPGQWWAAIESLWPALHGHAHGPSITEGMQRELYLRRTEVLRFYRGIRDVMRAPWPRLSGLPLPAWDSAQWQPIVEARLARQRQDAIEAAKKVRMKGAVA